MPKRPRGLALPNPMRYYRAAHLVRLTDWCWHMSLKLWQSIEQAQSNMLLRRAAWCFPDLPTPIRAHPTISPTLKLSANTLSFSPLVPEHSPLPVFPILGNLHFPLGLLDGPFRTVLHSQCFRASHFLISTNWPSLPILAQASGPFHLAFLRALQLRHFLCLPTCINPT